MSRLEELRGDVGAEARTLVASLNPPARDLDLVERFVCRVAEAVAVTMIDEDAGRVLRDLRWCVETGITRVSALPMLTPRGDQLGEPVTGRPEPQL